MDNPVLWKELRSKMRGRRPFLVQAAYLLLLSLFFSIGYFVSLEDSGRHSYDPAEMGRTVFAWMAFTQLVLVTFIAPALTSGVVSGEKEQKTLGLLFTTLLKRKHIIWGKLFSSLSFLLLLILSSMPLLCLSLVLGGVSPVEIAISYLLLLFSAVTFGMIGLSCSTHFRKTSIATVVTYVMVLFLVIGLAITAELMVAIGYHYGYGYIPWEVIGPFSPFYSLAEFLFDGGTSCESFGYFSIPAWVATLIYYSGISSVFYLVAAKAFKRLRRSVY